MVGASAVRFPLRFKVLGVLFVVMIVILVLSNGLYYWSTKSILEQKAIGQNKLVSEQLNLEIQQSQRGQSFIDDLIGNELRMAALAAETALNPDAAKVTNQQLRQLAKEIGVSGITLFQPTKDDIVGVKSSDPKEIGLKTKQMNLWYQAFRDLLKGDPAASHFGKAEPNYWTGPFANATSDPSKIVKWGYYYDGTTNYIIDPFIESSSLTDYTKYVGAGTFIADIQKSEPRILSIAVLNQDFGKAPISYSYQGENWVDTSNQPVMYGTYAYQDKTLDVAAKNKAFNSKQVVSLTDIVNHRRVFKTFVPETLKKTRYVVEIVSDYSFISGTLNQQLHNSLLISAALLLIIVILSYIASGFIVRPLRLITEKVNKLAARDFAEPLQVRGSDEIGVLADSVNVMSSNLLDYFNESVRKKRGQGTEHLVMVTHQLLHELGTPLIAIKFSLDFLPKVQGEMSERGAEIVSRMKVASEYANNVVREFSDFLKNGKLRFCACNLVEMIEGAIGIMRPIADTNYVVLKFVNATGADKVMVEVDKEKFQMVILNLMKNGIEAMDDTSTPREIRVELHPGQHMAQIDVTDTGRGIPPDQWDAIFLPYHSTKKHGLGLGLAFSGFIVLAHGGTIHVVHSDTAGTTMRIRLPLSE